MRRLIALALLAITCAPGAAAQVMADSFDMLLPQPPRRDHRVALLLATPDAGQALPAVLILPDEAGLDGRTARLADAMLARGWVGIEVDPDPILPDGGPAPAPPTPRHLGLLLRALGEALRRDERIDPRRIAVIGLGPGGRAAIHAAQGHGGPRFAAHAALYPDCTALAAGQDAPVDAPALLLLPGAEEPMGACAGLGAGLMRLEGATYGWDLAFPRGLRRWTVAGSTPIHPDRVASQAAEAALTGFLAEAFSRVR